MGFFSDIKRNSHKSSVSNWIRNERNLGKKPKTMNKKDISLDTYVKSNYGKNKKILHSALDKYKKKKAPKKKPIGLKSFSFTN